MRGMRPEAPRGFAVEGSRVPMSRGAVSRPGGGARGIGDGGKERALSRFDQNMKRVGIPAREGALADDWKRMV